MADSLYTPFQTVNQPGGSQILDKNLNGIKSALDALAQAEPNPAVITKTVDYSILPSDTYVLMSPKASANLVASLPVASKTKGALIYVKNIGPSGATVDVRAPKTTIDGDPAALSLNSNQVARLLSDGTAYWLL